MTVKPSREAIMDILASEDHPSLLQRREQRHGEKADRLLELWPGQDRQEVLAEGYERCAERCTSESGYSIAPPNPYLPQEDDD